MTHLVHGILVVFLSLVHHAARSSEAAPQTFETRYARIRIDEKGFITSLKDRKTGKKYSPAGHPSPVMSLHENGQPNEKLLPPVAATFGEDRIELKYPNGALATVKCDAREDYFRLQLVLDAPGGRSRISG